MIKVIINGPNGKIGRAITQSAYKNPIGVKVKNRKVIRFFDNPLYKEGGLAVLKGNLSPEGCY